MSTQEWYLFGHLLGVFFLLAATGLTTGAAIAAGRATAANTVVTLLDLQLRSERIVTSIGAILAIVFGSLLVNEAGYSFGDAWISTAYTLIILALALDHGFYLRKVKAAREVAVTLGNGPVTAELRDKLNDGGARLAGIVLTLLWLVFLWLMIAKPGA
ncbi:DUF2269 family protein [Tepidiforma sp.]|uniref:DUF2269 family protein n=1 Tax=Tepidiforma sp. TaxID=2682230 RepID=UPI0021DC0F60|nr:DUF2269 family protein [Tepidiforma sp.]MCX7618373.1 DUF2269 family protein [Tepidiforma sp.]GIW18777.1 MAG: hypothetical protein KatS3mg064_1934 [Tepidiforma sp.]